jgi:uncharacterized DUF497 family protein
MIEYEWNEDKRLSNLERHGLDFRRAYLVYENPGKLTLKSRYSHEPRLVDIAEVEGRAMVLVYTLRRDAVRCISFRYAKRKERRMFDEQEEDC